VPAQVEHITVAASDLARSAAFYDAIFAPLGIARVAEFGDEEEDDPDLEAIGYSDGAAAQIWLVAVLEDEQSTRHAHLRLRAEHRADVEAFHAAGLAAGGFSRAAPRRWAIYRSGEFGAAVADPDGNVIEAVSAE
jgi:catechol 2,3-dioxygenase-like lactoylglutathione lyase family enzyme